jgi:hypothetical protein
MIKICCRCKNELDSSCFDKDCHNKDGYQGQCKSCRRISRSKPKAQIVDVDGEIWKDIIGYEGLYQVSNKGRVKSLDRMVLSRFGDRRILRRGNIIVPTGKKRYLLVKLCRDGELVTRSLHKIVAIHFVDNPFNLPDVNHKDGVKSHNWSDNLEWSTESDNQLHAIRMGLQKTKLSLDDIHRCQKMRKDGMKIIDISKIIGGVSAAHIGRIISGKHMKRFNI